MNRRVVWGVVIFLATAAVSCAQDLVIESSKDGQNNGKYKEIAGPWLTSQIPPISAKSSAPGLTDANKCGSRKYLFSDGSPTTPKKGGNAQPAAVRFSPGFAAAGHYHVYVTWPRAANAGPVNFVIKHAKGTETKTFNQDGWGSSGESNANKWISLGDYDFSAGEDQYVELKTEASVEAPSPKNFGQVYADSVRFSSQPLQQTGTAPLPTVAPPDGTTSLPPPLTVPGSTAELSPMKWYDSIGTGQQAASQSGKRILVFFYAPESAGSKHFEQLFENNSIKGIINSQYVLVRINFIEQTKLAYNLGVYKAGTINLYDAQGNAIRQITDRLTPNEFTANLK
jgi:hypothetical protein